MQKWVLAPGVPPPFFLYTPLPHPALPFLCLPGFTIQTTYSQTIKTQHLLMVPLTGVPLEHLFLFLILH